MQGPDKGPVRAPRAFGTTLLASLDENFGAIAGSIAYFEDCTYSALGALDVVGLCADPGNLSSRILRLRGVHTLPADVLDPRLQSKLVVVVRMLYAHQRQQLPLFNSARSRVVKTTPGCFFYFCLSGIAMELHMS